MAKRVYKWIQKAGLKKGAFSGQLGIAMKEKIPIPLLNKIINAKAGETIKNPSSLGKRKIKVTALLKKRANFVRNLKKIGARRGRIRKRS